VVESAGIAARRGGGAAAEASSVMQEIGLDLSAHASQPLTDRMARNADLILTMTRGHRDAVVNEWPETADRVHLLRGDGTDVADPIGRSRDVYLECSRQIDVEIKAWVDRMELT
jgi:protein-tyrosine-phosphatase